jgi:hypothetical protein
MSEEFSQLENSPWIHRSWLSGFENDADRELGERSTLSDLRRISARLVKQNLIAAGIQQAYINMVCGGNIIVNCLGERKIDKLLVERLKSVDLDGLMSLTDMVAQMVTSATTGGDVLVTMPIHDGKKYVELIEAGRINTPSDLVKDPTIRLGIKYKGKKMVGAYVRQLIVSPHQTKSYVDSSENYKYFPFYTSSGKRLAMLFRMPLNIRPDQTRMYPLLTPIMNMLRYIDTFLEYNLVSSMVASSFSVFIRSKNPEGTRDNMAKQNQTGLKNVGQLSPGQIFYLNGASESVEFASPNRPSDNADQFLRRLLRLVSMTMRMPYETLFLDLSEANYSSFKSGSLEVNRNKRRWDSALRPVLDWICREMLNEMWSNGIINKTPESFDLSIVMPKLGVIDEEKTARADRMSITDNKTKSQRLVIDESGEDFDIIQEHLDEEALIATERQAKVLVRQKQLEEKYDIEFNPEAKPTDEAFDPESESNKDNRKDDGNW